MYGAGDTVVRGTVFCFIFVCDLTGSDSGLTSRMGYANRFLPSGVSVFGGSSIC